MWSWTRTSLLGKKREAEGTRYAALRYSVGLERNVGVKLHAICATEAETFASVFVPEDDVEAQYHLMGWSITSTNRALPRQTLHTYGLGCDTLRG